MFSIRHHKKTQLKSPLNKVYGKEKICAKRKIFIIHSCRSFSTFIQLHNSTYSKMPFSFTQRLNLYQWLLHKLISNNLMHSFCRYLPIEGAILNKLLIRVHSVLQTYSLTNQMYTNSQRFMCNNFNFQSLRHLEVENVKREITQTFYSVGH